MKKFYILTPSIFCSVISIVTSAQSATPGADRPGVLLPVVKDKKIALIVNRTPVLSDGTHLPDAPLSHLVQISKICVPGHGFRGETWRNTKQ